MANTTAPSVGSASDIQFVVTGFGPFRGVTENPTTQLVHALQQEKEQGGDGNDDNGDKSSIHSLIVMEVSVQAVQETLRQIIQQVQSEKKPNGDSNSIINNNNNNDSTTNEKSTSIVLLHLGVNYRGKCIQIEQCAYNDATFRIPDEQGYQPKHQAICDDEKWGTKQNSRLNAHDIRDLVLAQQQQRKQEEEGCDDETPALVEVSTNPGRFVCNYTYYQSMSQTTQAAPSNSNDLNLYSLFVHVPPFHVMDEPKQLQYIKDIMKAVGTTLG